MSRTANTIRIGDVVKPVGMKWSWVVYRVSIDPARGRVLWLKCLYDFAESSIGSGDRTPAITCRGRLDLASTMLALAAGREFIRTGVRRNRFDRWRNAVDRLIERRRKAVGVAS